jgi:hypothetical protein
MPSRVNGGASTHVRLSWHTPNPGGVGRGMCVRGIGRVGYTRVSIDIIIPELSDDA